MHLYAGVPLPAADGHPDALILNQARGLRPVLCNNKLCISAFAERRTCSLESLSHALCEVVPDCDKLPCPSQALVGHP